MKKKRYNKHCPVKFYVALQGNKTPDQYRRLGKTIEKLGYDRIYVYDDLMYRPSWPILSLLADNTTHIELGPCLVNGFYRHPAIIAENAVFLDEMCGGRSILGMGRGAFLEYLDMPHDEQATRMVCEESIQLVKRFIARDPSPFRGQYFSALEEAVLRWQPVREHIPLVMGSWNKKMAVLAGKHCDELQVAESWDRKYLEILYAGIKDGMKQSGREKPPYFSIGGITCVARDRTSAYRQVKRTLAVYLPYFTGIMSHMGLDTRDDTYLEICKLSRSGRFEDAAQLVPDHIADALSLSGEPDEVKTKLEHLLEHVDIRGILFSPPYGPSDDIQDNLAFIMDQVVMKIKKKYT